MQLPDIFSKITKDKVPFIVGGIVAGALGLWLIGKIFSPWVSPIIKDACLSYLDMKPGRDSMGERVVEVEAVRVSLGTMTQRIVTVGKLRANEEVMLRSEMAGRIKEISFTEGEEVSKGDTLIEFEDAELIAEVDLSAAETALKQADFERISTLRSRNIESAKKYDESKAALEMAKAKLERAKAQLEKAKIVAPFSGTIGLIDVSVGAYVQSAQDLVKLVDNKPIKIDFKVPEQNVHDVGVGQTAEIKLDGFPDEIFKSSVISVDASLDAVSHSLSMRASAPNEDGRLRAGMFASVSLIIGEKGNSIVIPESAVTRDGEREFVWLVVGGRVGRKRVITGTREKGMVEIVQGLHQDELVVTAGQIKLGEGTSVNVTNLDKPEDEVDEVQDDTPAKDAGTTKTTEKSEKKVEPKPIESSAKETPKEEPMEQEVKDQSTLKEASNEEPKKDNATKESQSASAVVEPTPAQQEIQQSSSDATTEKSGKLKELFGSLRNLFSKGKE